MYTTNLNNLDNPIVNNHQMESPLVSGKFTQSNLDNEETLTLYCELLHQVENLKIQLKQEKLTDKIIYQSLKRQLST